MQRNRNKLNYCNVALNKQFIFISDLIFAYYLLLELYRKTNKINILS